MRSPYPAPCLTSSGGFPEKVASGLTRSALDRFVGVVGEAGQIVERNLYRAAELIGSFKQLAVDQSSYQRRPFDLQDVVREIMLAMAPSIRRTPYRIIDEVPAGLVLDSYPGPLGQILMNLINNALIHAFDGRDSGQVLIRAETAEPGWIVLSVADDGCGISAEHRKRIFDPFFTDPARPGWVGARPARRVQPGGRSARRADRCRQHPRTGCKIHCAFAAGGAAAEWRASGFDGQ